VEGVYDITGLRRAKPGAVKRRAAPGLAAQAGIALPPLPAIPDATFLRPGQAGFATYLPLHNQRNDAVPALRIMCTSTQAVSDCVKWVRQHALPFAVRGGGHCYEGFSQSTGVVIDLRKMGLVTVDAAQAIVSVSAGASLGKVYKAVAAQGFAFAAGSCPTVGVAGHTLGGGQGLLGRKFGLACDNLVGVRMVDAIGMIRETNATQDADLFWACKGGGGGSFGIATRFQFRIHALTHVHTFSVSWKFANTTAALADASQVFNAWQNWAPSTVKDITAIMKLQKTSDGKLRLAVIGQSTGARADLEQQLETNLIVRPPTVALAITRKSFRDAAAGFAGTGGLDQAYAPVFMKAKSDFVPSPLPATGMRALFKAILAAPANTIVAICDPYGGAIADVPASASAFPHRGPNTYAIQYYAQWSSASQTPARIGIVTQVHQALRPFLGHAAYVNYCDMQITNFAAAYWGANLTRLRQIKQATDPANLFHHGQSVPLP
jgi:FAD/FMN-containing dehydrogenase